MTRLRFAELLGVSDQMAQQWEYGRRGISARRAARLARRIGKPAWHFEQALLQDRLADGCKRAEITAVVVGLAAYVESRLPGEQWATVRAMLLEGA